MKIRAALLAAGLIGLPMLGCSGSLDPEEELRELEQELANGTTAEQCALPSVVWLDGARSTCTAVLVHPQVILLAAHCTGAMDQGTVYFGEDDNGIEITPSSCAAYPGWSGGEADIGIDWGYCVLPQAVDLPIVPILPRACAEEVLREPNQELLLSGFGRNEHNAPSGTKRWGWTAVDEVNWTNDPQTSSLWTKPGGSGAPSVACPGDSGGSSLIQLPDGTWWSVAVAGWLERSSPECGLPSNRNGYAFSDDAVSWIDGVHLIPTLRFLLTKQIKCRSVVRLYRGRKVAPLKPTVLLEVLRVLNSPPTSRELSRDHKGRPKQPTVRRLRAKEKTKHDISSSHVFVSPVTQKNFNRPLLPSRNLVEYAFADKPSTPSGRKLIVHI